MAFLGWGDDLASIAWRDVERVLRMADGSIVLAGGVLFL